MSFVEVTHPDLLAGKQPPDRQPVAQELTLDAGGDATRASGAVKAPPAVAGVPSSAGAPSFVPSARPFGAGRASSIRDRQEPLSVPIGGVKSVARASPRVVSRWVWKKSQNSGATAKPAGLLRPLGYW